MSSLIRRVSGLALFSLLAACTGDDSSPPGGGEVDATPDTSTGSGDTGAPGDDAAVLVTPDAGAMDATMDATTDASTGNDDAASDATTIEDAGSVADTGPTEASAEAAAPVPGLVLRYQFDQGSGSDIADTSGNGHDGTLERADAGADAGTGWRADGRISGAAAFTGSQDVTVPSGVFTSATSTTIGAWVRLVSRASWSRLFDFGNGPVGTGDRWTFLTVAAGADGPVQWNVYGGLLSDGGTREAVVAPGTQLPLGVWKHIAVTASGTSYRMYIDGFPAADLAGGPAIPLSEMEPLTPASWLGKSRFPDAPLNGDVDELRVYSRVLSASEVEDLAWPQHDYSAWRFDEGTGATASDSSDNAVSGALTGGATWTASGRLGGALDLPGGAAGTTGPYVTLASDPLASCTSAFTVSSWVKIHTAADWSRVWDFGTGTTAFTYLTPADGNGKLHFAMVAPAGAFNLVAPSGFPADNAWHHVAVTAAANGDVVIYVDGASVMTGNSPNVKPSAFTGTTDNWLGKSRFPDPYLNGSIDELRVACRVYTSDGIKNLAHGP